MNNNEEGIFQNKLIEEVNLLDINSLDFCNDIPHAKAAYKTKSTVGHFKKSLVFRFNNARKISGK